MNMNMNKILGLSLLAASVATSFQATAASTDLTITGEIANGACDVTLEDSGIVDFGDILNSSLVAGGTKLDDKIVGMSILCQAPSYIAFHITDNRADSVFTGSVSGAPPVDRRYGLNRDSSGNAVGFYAFHMASTSLNSVNGVTAGNMIYRVNNQIEGGTWQSLGNTIYTGVGNYLSFAEPSTTTPTPVNNVDVNLTVKTTLAPTSDLNTTQEITLDGSSTVEIIYL
jgi:type 1 fimbria pilin